jgi:hypothetical protein
MFRWIFRRVWAGLIWLKQGWVADTCEFENEPSISIKCGEFLDKLRTYLLKKDYSMELVS